MRTVTRHQLYQYFLNECVDIPQTLVQMIFKSMSDEDLAKQYGLTILRRGYFY